MLRRKPTALTISPEDLSAFEEAHIYNKALRQYRKTGIDPHGWFKHLDVGRDSRSRRGHAQTSSSHHAQQQQQQQQFGHHGSRNNDNANNAIDQDNRANFHRHQNHARNVSASAVLAIDPNDELKPLPGDKARIVRSREERIVGAGAGLGAGNSSNASSAITNSGAPNAPGVTGAGVVTTNNDDNTGLIGRGIRGAVGDVGGAGGAGAGGREGEGGGTNNHGRNVGTQGGRGQGQGQGGASFGRR